MAITMAISSSSRSAVPITIAVIDNIVIVIVIVISFGRKDGLRERRGHGRRRVLSVHRARRQPLVRSGHNGNDDSNR
jgi:hypothetical protein